MPYTFVNGTTADGGQVSSNFTSVLGCINSFGSAGLEISGGDLILDGSNSGKVTIHPQANAGTWNLNLPTTAGSSGQAMLSGGGGLAPMSFGTLGVAGGGTGLAVGVSGGIPAFTGTTTITSSGLLTQHGLLIGGGAGAIPYSLPTGLGTTTTVLHGNATGDPTYTAVQNADLANPSLTIGTTSIALGASSLTLAGLTSVNKVAITAPATSATLTIADGKTLTINNSLIFAGVDAKTLTFNNSLTLAGTDATTMTFPTTSQTIAGLGVAQTFTAVQTINLNAATLQAPQSGTALHIGQANGQVSRLLLDAYASNPTLTCRRADTSAAAPSAVQATEVLCSINVLAYGLTGYTAASRASMFAAASEIWTDAAQGVYWGWNTTATGGTTTNEKMRLNASGNLSIGDTTDTDRLHVTGAVHLTTSMKMDGATSGTLTVMTAAISGANTLTLPAGTTDFSATGGTSQVVKQTSAGGAFTVARLACADLSDAAAGCASGGGIKTPVFGNSGTTGPATGATNYIGLGWVQATEPGIRSTIAFAGTLKNLYINLSTASAGGTSWAFTVRKNGADTTITCTITGGAATTNCNDVTHTATLAAGDVLTVKSVPAGVPAATLVDWGLELDPS